MELYNAWYQGRVRSRGGFIAATSSDSTYVYAGYELNFQNSPKSL